MGYKSCLVPQCKNTTIKTPQKLFVSVPKDPKRRKIWLKLARRNPESIVPSSNVFMCEDHFDMEKDMTNFMQYKAGFSQKILFSSEAVPTKFHCQEERKSRMSDVRLNRKAFLKRQRAALITECLQSHNTTETDAERLQEVFEPEASSATGSMEYVIKKEASSIDESFKIEPEPIAKPELITIKIEPYQSDDEVLNKGPHSESYDETLDITCCPVKLECIPGRNDNVLATTSSNKADVNTDLETKTNKKKHACQICKKEFSQANVRNRHMRIHSNDKKYSCDICKKRFTQKSDLNRHQRVHTKTKLQFSHRSGVMRQQLHAGIASHTCEICQNEFTYKCSSTKLGRIHTFENQFGCDVCTKQFNDKTALIRHLRIHTSELYKQQLPQSPLKRHNLHTNQKPHTSEVSHKQYTPSSTNNNKLYTCGICEKQFTQKSTLIRHMLNHTYSGPMCQKKFPHASALKQHERSHSRENSFVCVTCNKSFPFASHLERHARCHSGQIRYKCGICEKQFAEASNLKRHERSHMAGTFNGEKSANTEQPTIITEELVSVKIEPINDPESTIKEETQ